MPIEPYRALALQLACDAVATLPSVDAARAAIARSIDRVERALAGSLAFLGSDVLLVVLPEYLLTGFPMGDAPAAWIDKACLRADELERLCALAQRHRTFVAFNTYEVDPAFEGLYFQACLVIDDGGTVVLRYRRLNSMFAPTPHDVWDAYLDRYGLDGVFPVARTSLGNLAAVASEEILYPEIARAMALRGAEVLVHSTSEIHTGQPTAKDIAKAARAVENMAFVISANTAGVRGIAIPEQSADGGSKIFDPSGRVLASAGSGESMTACADIDVEGLRRLRRRPGLNNLLSRQRLEIARLAYAEATGWPANTLVDGRSAGPQHAMAVQARVIEALVTAGVIA